MRIHLVVNVNQIVQYNNQIKRQRKEEVKPIEVKEVKEQEVKTILNKRKVRGVIKYLVRWKRFIAKHNSQGKKKNLENTKKLVAEFERRMNTEVRRQEKLDLVEEKDLRGQNYQENIQQKCYIDGIIESLRTNI